MDCFSLLPNEIVIEIFSHLEVVLIMRRVSRVCRAWRQFSFDQHLWEYLDFTRGDLGSSLNDTTFKKSIELSGKLRGINMSHTFITNRGVDIIIKSCPDVEQIDFSYCSRLRSTNFDVLLSLPRLSSLNLIGTWKLTEETVDLIDVFLARSIKLGITLEAYTSAKSESQADKFINKLTRLCWIDLHLNQEFATYFLNHSLLPQFSSSIVAMEIGSRCLSAPFLELPSQIGRLTALVSLSVISHDMSTLPSEIVNLSNLRSLTISSGKNDYFCAIPEEVTSLHSLTSLNLSSNKIQCIPPSISRMTSLTKLNLSSNALSEVAPQVGQLTALRRLEMSNNMITLLPHTLGQLSRLERLICARNSIEAIPAATFKNMKKLEVLDLQANKLFRIPDTIAQPSLKELYLNENMLESIPALIGVQLTALKKLALQHNCISRLPLNLSGLGKVKLLSLQSNRLESLPVGIEHLTSLKTLELSNNRLKELPPTMPRLQRLRRIELQSNHFSTFSSLCGINDIESLKSVQFDPYLQEGHSERCMCKFCIYSRFDEAHFDDIVEGDAGFESELINLFFNCTENDFQAMREALESNNFHSIFFVSHKIKGALSNMGALKLSSLCTLLEKQARSQCIVSCRDVFGQLQTEYGHIKQVLTRRLESHALTI